MGQMTPRGPAQLIDPLPYWLKGFAWGVAVGGLVGGGLAAIVTIVVFSR